MDYEFETGGRTIAVSFDSKDQGRASARINDQAFEIRFDRVSDHQISMTVNGRQVNAWMEKEPDGKIIILDGERYKVRDRLQQDRPRACRTGLDQEPLTVTPPMPAIVVKVDVAEGDRVEKGQTVVVVSAMKMETSLRAPYDGRVTRIRTAEGDKVMPGDILVDIDPDVQVDKEAS
ncbi:MAG: biotin/lipoyl-containing protein [Pseudomonadota bacterium]